MIQFIKKYKAFIVGYIIIVPIFYLMDYLGLIILPENRTYEMLIYALIWGTLIALPFHNHKYLKSKKNKVIGLTGLIFLFFFTLIVDSKMSMPDNPITIILLMSFWIGLGYIFIPSFVKKYWKLIAFFYIPLLLYFIYLRVFTGSFEAYLLIKESSHFFVFFIPLPILFFVFVFEQWKWVQNLKADKSKTELSLLRSQINPHFFFNTLNNLYALTIKNSKQAPEVILKLSDMMRYTIYEGEKEKVTLQDEIEYLNNYIELHKIRYKKTVDIQFTKDIDNQTKVAPLLFIILLENAFKHGIETLTEKAYIHMNIEENKDEVLFEIENNFDIKEISNSKGIGLKNLKRRLTLLYPQQHEITVDKTTNTYKTTLKITKHA